MRTSLALLLILFSGVCYGQTYHFFTSDRELPSNLVNQIYQDRDGIIWIASEDGLVRYDGAKFTVYRHDPSDAHSIAHDGVRSILQDSQGHLFIGTYRGIQVYDPATDSFSPPAARVDGGALECNVTHIVERRSGQIWISGSRVAQVTVEADTLVAHEPDLPISARNLGAMTEDAQGGLWIWKYGKGIYHIKADGSYSLYPPSQTGNIVTLYATDDGCIYAGASGGGGLLLYDPTTDSFHPLPCEGRDRAISVDGISQGNGSMLYLATDGQGLKVLNHRKRTISTFPLDNNYFNSATAKVHGVLLDREGNLWVAVFQKGILLIPARDNGFQYIGSKSTSQNLIGSSCITTILRDSEDMIWVGTDNDGLYRLVPDVSSEHFTGNHVPATVEALMEDSHGQLWVGSYGSGMGMLDRATGRVSPVVLTDENGQWVPNVYAFAEDRQGRLWIGTMGNDLFYIDLTTHEVHTIPSINRTINDYICSLCYSQSGLLYAGTSVGLSSIDIHAAEPTASDVFRGHIALVVREDRQGRIWAGCTDGLYCHDPTTGTLTTYTTSDGLPSNSICSIEEDEEGHMWLSTGHGLARMNTESATFTCYYLDDGLQGNEFSSRASYCDTDGNIWFGGMNGITWFRPTNISDVDQHWDVRITGFYLGEKSVHQGVKSGCWEVVDCAVYEAEQFHLAHTDHAFTVELATVQLSTPGRVAFTYALDDGPWTTLTKGTNLVTFSDLKAGRHRLRVCAMSGGSESTTGTVKQVSIYIHPAWWATWWARMAYIIVALTLLIVAIIQIRRRYRLREVMKQRRHKAEINEAMLQFFTNVSHEIRTPMSLIISPLQQLIAMDKDQSCHQLYLTIYRNAERILRLVNQLLDMRKVDKGQMLLKCCETEIVGFINDLCDTFTWQTQAKHLTLSFTHEGIEELKLWVDPACFDKIVVNLLSNALKFTPEGGRIDINLRQGEDSSADQALRQNAELTVSDTGIGIIDTEKERVFERFYQVTGHTNRAGTGTGIGLHLTRSLVELHRGKIWVEDRPDGVTGSRFVVRLPLGHAHLRAEEISDGSPATPTLRAPAIAADALATTDAVATPSKTGPRTRYRVMVVEDDEEIRRYVAKELSADCHIRECHDGQEALAALFDEGADLVISDVMMPGMDGLSLCRKIKQNVSLNHIPVVLLTAKVREQDQIEGLGTGADAYVTKPFSMEVLRTTVIGLISSREKLRNIYSGQQSQEDKVEQIEAKSPDDRLMERIMRAINANLDNPELTVEMLASEVGLSRVHLHRKLKELTNQSTRDFIRNVRLGEAARLLSEKRHSISEVSLLTGFSHPNNFSKAFSERYGMSPTAYREKHLATNKDKTGTEQPE